MEHINLTIDFPFLSGKIQTVTGQKAAPDMFCNLTMWINEKDLLLKITLHTVTGL